MRETRARTVHSSAVGPAYPHASSLREPLASLTSPNLTRLFGYGQLSSQSCSGVRALHCYSLSQSTRGKESNLALAGFLLLAQSRSEEHPALPFAPLVSKSGKGWGKRVHHSPSTAGLHCSPTCCFGSVYSMSPFKQWSPHPLNRGPTRKTTVVGRSSTPQATSRQSRLW